MKNRTCRNILLALLAFLSLGALGDDFVLMVSPEGALMGMPLPVVKTFSGNSNFRFNC